MRTGVWTGALLAGSIALAANNAAAQEKIGGELNVLSWGDYIDFAIKPFEEKYGTKINIDYYASEQEAINKIRAAGLGTYDVVFLGVGFDDVAMQQGLLEPLDVSRLSNFPDLFQRWQQAKPDGQHYCVTYAWGANGLIIYNKDHVPEGEIKSWSDVFSGKYDGRIGRIDKANEQTWRTAQQLRLGIHELTAEEWEKVAAQQQENVKQARTVYQHYDQMHQLLSGGDIWIADTDDGAYRQALDKGIPVGLVFPEEGFHGWSDGPCLVKSAPHPEAAYAFIDHMISPETQSGVAREVGYAPANKKAAAGLEPDLQKRVGVDNAEERISRLEILRTFGQEFNDRMEETWQRAKASAQR